MNLPQLNKVANEMSPELRYAIMHWATHVQFSKNSSNDMLDGIVDVFGAKKKNEVLPVNLHTWWIIYCALQNNVTQKELGSSSKKVATTLLHTMARIGLYDLLVAAQKSDQHWETAKLGISSQDCTFSTPTLLAIFHNDARMLTFLRTVTDEVLFATYHYIRACSSNAQILDLV